MDGEVVSCIAAGERVIQALRAAGIRGGESFMADRDLLTGNDSPTLPGASPLPL